MILHVENSKDSIKKTLLEPINEFSKVTGYKTNTQKSVSGTGPVAKWLSSRAPLQAAQCFVGTNPGRGHGTAHQAMLRQRPTCHN